MKPYKLMCSLFAHASDVKSLCATRDTGGFVSVSRDLTAHLWQCTGPELNQYSAVQTISGAHTKFVNTAVVVYTLAEYPEGLVITGSNDQTIAVYSIQDKATIAHLREHQGPVCTLRTLTTSKGVTLLVSGSFDHTAKVWNLSALAKSHFAPSGGGGALASVATLRGHEQTVWSVLCVDAQSVILTASADKTIKQWQLNAANTDAEYICRYVGHTDCVRGLARHSQADTNSEFFSCANDGTVKRWRMGHSAPLASLKVTDTFLYSINTLPPALSGVDADDDSSTCYFVTSGEDRTLRIHAATTKSNNAMHNVQTIALPCQTLWYALGLPDGRIGVACSDGSIRLFTQSEAAAASAGEQAEYERELSQCVLPTKVSGGSESSASSQQQVDRLKLPGEEALGVAGERDGQTLMVNNGKEIDVYQWSGAEAKWVMIGTMVGSSDSAGSAGASGSSKKTSYLGQEYDYVFDIELDDAGTKLKLPYNLSDDPYHVAQRFIHTHELSQMFLDQIAQFLIKNTQSETIGMAASASDYYDPFTGAGRYVPQSGGGGSSHQQMDSSSSSSYVDPFTGSGAYRSGSAAGGGGQQAPPPAKKQATLANTAQSNDYYPHRDFILFDQCNCEPILKKLKEFQQQLAAAPRYQGVELVTDKSNIELLEHLVLNYDAKSTGLGQFNDQIDLLFQMIDSWPKENVFPLLDLARILVLNKEVAAYLCRNQSLGYLSTKQAHANSNSYFNTLFKLIDRHSPVNTMLVVKVVCNAFKALGSDVKNNANGKQVLSLLLNERAMLLDKLALLLDTDNKSFQIAFSTLLLNYVVLFYKLAATAAHTPSFTTEFYTDVSKDLLECINDEMLCDHVLNWDVESIFRMLVCYGTLLSKTNTHLDVDFLISVACSLRNFNAVCENVHAKSAKYPEKVQKCVAHLTKLLSNI